MKDCYNETILARLECVINYFSRRHVSRNRGLTLPMTTHAALKLYLLCKHGYHKLHGADPPSTHYHHHTPLTKRQEGSKDSKPQMRTSPFKSTASRFKNDRQMACDEYCSDADRIHPRNRCLDYQAFDALRLQNMLITQSEMR